jgi:hypothetical protein
MANDNFFPWDDIPDSNVFPAMTGRFTWDKLEDGHSQSTNKRMFKANFICMEPEMYAGMYHTENYVVGNDENLNGIIPGTMGARSMKSALAAAQVPKSNDPAQLCAVVTQSKPQLLLSLSLSKQETGEYAGREQNRVTSYNKVGERPVQVMGGQVANKSTAPIQAPAMPTMPGTTAAPAPAPGGQVGAPAAPAAPTPAAPAQAASAPAAPAAPQQQAAPAPTPGAPAPPPGGAPAGNVAAPDTPEQTLKCSICGEDVPMSGFAAHTQAHMQAG